MRGTTRRRDIDRDRVRDAVATAERRTSAEIVVSIAPFFLGDVDRAAGRAFDQLGVANTRGRTGVLVFVVPGRHRVVVLADDGAAARIPAAVWQDVASAIATAFARADGTAGLIDGIGRLADALALAFPAEPGDVDELPNLFG